MLRAGMEFDIEKDDTRDSFTFSDKFFFPPLNPSAQHEVFCNAMILVRQALYSLLFSS
jgi:hypothetical protein